MKTLFSPEMMAGGKKSCYVSGVVETDAPWKNICHPSLWHSSW